MKDLLYLKDEQIKDFIQLLFYAYRETFSDSKNIPPGLSPPSVARYVELFIPEITSAPLEEFTNIKGIGEITGTIIFRWFKVEENIILINNLQSLGINSENNLEDRKSFELENLTFVITGRLDNITRGEAKNIIEKFGGKTSNSVSKNTNFLVSGEKPGSKLATAITLNIPILTEQDFLQFLKDHNI